MSDPSVLVIAVNYKTEEHALKLAALFDGAEDAELVIADNSPEASAALEARADALPAVRYMSFPDNPLYVGAARRVVELLADEAGPLSYDAVVLCNVDVSFAVDDLVAAVEAAHAHTGDHKWILAPRIIEPGRKYEPNPHVMKRPARFNRRVFMRFFPTWIVFRQLYRWRRRNRVNPNAGAPAFTTMYSAHGAFVVFGADFFRAGGSFHEGPLFGEERGFAEQAKVLDVPTFFIPELAVCHAYEASTSARLNGNWRRFAWQRAADRFYDSWEPASATGWGAERFSTSLVPPRRDATATTKKGK